MNPKLNYHLLRGKVIGMDSQVKNNNFSHLLLLVKYQEDNINKFTEVAINENSRLAPFDVQHCIINNFENLDKPRCDYYLQQNYGYTKLDNDNLLENYGIDYTKYNLKWTISNNHEIANLLRNTLLCELNNINEEYEIFVLGTRFIDKGDNINFGFKGDNGIHDCHMNQFNAGKFAEDNGYYQDGCILLYNKSQNTWTGIFIKFQSQITPENNSLKN